VTIALGILCCDGAVLAADSQETTHGYWKRRQTKVASSTAGPKQDLSIAVAGAGRAGYVDALVEELLTAASSAAGHWENTLAAIRQSLVQFHNTHVIPYQADLPEVPLVFALQKGRHVPYLFVTDRSTIAPTHDFAAVGIGAGHALTILNRLGLGRMDLDINTGIALAAYAIHHTKAHVADCGDITEIVAIKRGQTLPIPLDAAEAMDDVFSQVLETVEPLFVRNLLADRTSMRVLSKLITQGRRILRKASKRRLVWSGVERVVGSEPTGSGESSARKRVPRRSRRDRKALPPSRE
jgi:20S proteasome alpha/beta subunit